MADYNDMPDVGTLGGTMQDAYGESSATYGGYNSPDQMDANGDFMFDDFMPYDLASMYSYGSPSSKVYGNPEAPNTTPFAQGLATVNDFFQRNPVGKIAGPLLNFHPAGQIFNAARGVANMLGQGRTMDAGVSLLGQFGGTPGAVINAGYQASRGNFAPAGGMAGGRFAGPLGAMVGAQAGRAVSGRGGPNVPGTVGMSEGGGGFDLGGAVQGLGSLWAASQADKGLSAAQGSNDALQAQMTSLGSMYGPNSPYAAQLRQTLERKDAAAGRRSQYGPREAQLMAALADKQAGVASTIGNLATSNQANQIALNNQRNQTRGQQLALLTNLGRQSGLFNMFSGGGAATPKLLPQYDDSYGDSTWMGSE